MIVLTSFEQDNSDVTVIVSFSSGHRTLMATQELCSSPNLAGTILPVMVILDSA